MDMATIVRDKLGSRLSTAAEDVEIAKASVQGTDALKRLVSDLTAAAKASA